MVKWLFGFVPAGLALLCVGGDPARRICGVPVRSGKKSPALRLLAVIDTAVTRTFSPTTRVIVTLWPQRILAFYAPFTCGGARPLYLLRGFRPIVAPPWFRNARALGPPSPSLLSSKCRFSGSRNVRANMRLRDSILNRVTNASGRANVDRISRFICAACRSSCSATRTTRHLILFTEWSATPHPPG